MTGADLLRQFREARKATMRLVAPLAVEDFVAAAPDASPVKWHLGHTTWFLEHYLLIPHAARHQRSHPEYDDLFDPGRRPLHRNRGLWTRPTVAEVLEYRRVVEDLVGELVEAGLSPVAETPLAMGIHHEALHQELLLTELKRLFWKNPLHPAYRQPGEASSGRRAASPLRFLSFAGGEVGIGHDGDGFAFANELPRHRALVHPFQLASRLITNREFQEFIHEDGYRTRSLWLADGWEARERFGWEAPLYWERDGEAWIEFGFEGLRALDPGAPVAHVSLHEADAFARWRGARLPTEFEWEAAAGGVAAGGACLESGRLAPAPADAESGGPGNSAPTQLLGDVWEWTGSAHRPYPGYRAEDRVPGDPTTGFFGARAVLRGGSCLTPSLLARRTTRHHLAPESRLACAGIRLARDLPG